MAAMILMLSNRACDRASGAWKAPVSRGVAGPVCCVTGLAWRWVDISTTCGKEVLAAFGVSPRPAAWKRGANQYARRDSGVPKPEAVLANSRGDEGRKCGRAWSYRPKGVENGPLQRWSGHAGVFCSPCLCSVGG